MSRDRDKILRYYQSSGEGELAARLLDLAENVVSGRRWSLSEFLDPFGVSVAETIAAHFDVLLSLDGGYQGAERVRAVFSNREFPGQPNFALNGLRVKWDPRYYKLSHRDVLGALTGLGVKRGLIGDIIMLAAECQLVVDSSLAAFIQANLTQAGQATVTVAELSLTAIAPREEKTKEICTTVASLRLDVIAAAGFSVSRTRMAAEINGEKIKVNWQNANNCAKEIKAGDVISIRGRGRVEVCEVLGQTKKGRISVRLKRFI